MDDRERRLAQNSAHYREVNERTRIVDRAAANVDLVCECADRACTKMIHISADDYEAVRNDGARFIVVRGHEMHDGEKIVARKNGFNVVEKTGASKAYTEARDPRVR
ncbi:MAG: hypothetical protein WKF41_04190 [Gaiellaceae bacterium]